MLDRFIRASELPAALGVSKRLISYWRARGEFPQPRRVGEKMVAWLESEISDWMKARPVVVPNGKTCIREAGEVRA